MSKPGPSHLDTDRPCSAYPKGCDRCRFRLFCFLASRFSPSPQPPGPGRPVLPFPAFVCLYAV